VEQQNLNDAGWIGIGFKFGVGFGMAGLIFAAIGALLAYGYSHHQPTSLPAAPKAAVQFPPSVVNPATPAQLPAAPKPAGERRHILIPPRDGKTCLQEARGMIDDNYEKCLKGSDYWTGGGSPGPPDALAAEPVREEQSDWAVLIVAAVNQHWTVPSGTSPALKATVSMTLSPAGEVQSAEVTAGSGVAAFDESLLRAINKASPLPLPGSPDAFVPNVDICFSPDPRSCQ